MYVTIDCPMCDEEEIVYNFNSPEHTCRKCSHKISTVLFWSKYNHASEEIAKRREEFRNSPEYYINLIESLTRLESSYQRLYRYEDSRRLRESIEEYKRELVECHGLDYDKLP